MNVSHAGPLLARAAGLAQSGRLAEAAEIYRRVLARFPNHADATHFLGLCLAQSGRTEEGMALIQRSIELAPDNIQFRQNYGVMLAGAERLTAAEHEFEAALRLQPSNATTRNYLGTVQQRLGYPEQALKSFREALRLRPRDSSTANNLGYCLFERGNLAAAMEWYRNAIAWEPRNAMAHNNFANALRTAGDPAAAVASYRRAIALDPQLAMAHYNLGMTLRDLGDLSGAYASARQAMRIAPDLRAAWQLLAEVLAQSQPPAWDASVADDLQQVLSQPDVDAGIASQAAARLLALSPAIGPAYRAAQQHDAGAVDWHSSGAPAHPLLLLLLENAVVASPGFERFLAQLRRSALEAWSRNALQDSPQQLGLLCALGQQCFLNEYVWPESPGETAIVAGLAGKAQLGATLPELALLSAYRALGAVESLGGSCAGGESGEPDAPSEQWVRLWRRQVEEPREERKLRDSIVALTPIEGSIVLEVKRQYEDNPYPRWHRPPSNANRFPLRLMLRTLFPHLETARLPQSDRLSVLIAGCGTGRHAAISGMLHPASRILAVDISRGSLAYATRRCRELGVDNVQFAQADLLRLGSALEERFDLIECAGVLHHLPDPLAGWRALLGLLKEDGVMKVGLYSETARRSISAARALLADFRSAADLAAIRAARALILSLPPDHPARAVERLPDFYTASGVRDLLLHVQEHVFTIDTLAAAIAALGLDFLGFEHADAAIARAYRERFPDDATATSLAHWRAFEADYPDTFAGMYQFWVRRRA